MMQDEDYSNAMSSITGTFCGAPNDEDHKSQGGRAENDTIFASQKLFGRTKEVRQLIEIFSQHTRRVKAVGAGSLCLNLEATSSKAQAVPTPATKTPQRLVVIHGKSGMGKTSVVEVSLRDEVVPKNQGFFCSGKFPQSNATTYDAYSAIMAAFSDLCDLVVQSEQF